MQPLLLQHALINIVPNGDYPIFCQDAFVSTGNQGSFDDGSSFENYQNNNSCSYVIQPECRGIIELEFENFNLGHGDFLQIWDGEPEIDVLIAEFDEFNQPDEIIYKSYSGKATLLFNSDDADVADGWKVIYNARACQYNLPVTQLAGSFDDGSLDCNYEKSLLCSWIIHPDNVNKIFLDFEYFDINGTADIVRIYKNNNFSANLLYTFNENNHPDQIYEILADTVIV
ncbi:hypothetical protein EOM81_07320, partial [bacterium]|nr:hypothetical protein [bacterium]